MKDVEIAVFIAAVVLFALLACGAVSLLVIFLLPAPDDGNVDNAPVPPDATGPEIVPPPPNASSEDLVIWSKINRKNVEMICLEKAREEAGSSAGLVYSCKCVDIEKPGIKSYRCDIETADPITAYFANIDCHLDREECDIETNYGFQKLNFTQLQDFE